MDNGVDIVSSKWRSFAAGLPMRTALVAVGTVWLLGCAWSYREQSEFAAAKGFTFPHLLPLVIDGLAVAMAGVSWAASLDARPAVPARLATLVAIAGSAASNGTWAWIRTGTAGVAGHDRVAVALGVAVPVAANLAFEVLLAELRRQVQRGRGLPPPVAIPQPRLVRVALAPWSTLRDWRRLVLEITDLALLPTDLKPAAAPPAVPDVRAESSPVHRVERPSTIEACAAAAPVAGTADPVRQEPDTAPLPAQPHLGTPPVQALTLLPTPIAGPAPATAVGDVPAVEVSDERVARLVELLRQGRPLTGASAAAEVGCSPRTGRRLLSDARDLARISA